jgi:hypothetical protein
VLLILVAAVVAGGIAHAVGGLAAKWGASGFDNDRLQRVGDSLTPGSSPIVGLLSTSGWMRSGQ